MQLTVPLGEIQRLSDSRWLADHAAYKTVLTIDFVCIRLVQLMSELKAIDNDVRHAIKARSFLIAVYSRFMLLLDFRGDIVGTTHFLYRNY